MTRVAAVETGPLPATDPAPGPLDVLPPTIRECLRRCAVAPTFDAATFHSILQPAGAPSLDLLVRLGQIEAVPGRSGRFKLPGFVREAAFEDWWTQDGRQVALQPPPPAELSELAARLGAQAREEKRSLTELDLALLHDQQAAIRLFRSLFEPAIDQHDLARSRAVLDVLDNPQRLRLLGPEIAEVRNKADTDLAARTLWSDDFHRSAKYVPRTAPEGALESLLRGKSARFLQLFATGGMGKSLQLKWFVARRCVPARIPCARVDFDDVRPVVIARLPWLLLLEVSAQFDRQVAGAPFQELLAAHGDYRSLLPRSTAGDEHLSSPRSAAHGEGEDVVARFCSALKDRAEDEPVVIILDTFEEALRPAVNPAGILDLLQDVTAKVKAVRIIVAGRYDLRDVIAARGKPRPEDGRRHRRVDLTSHQLMPLTRAEQDRYLKKVRAISDDGLVEQIERLSVGLPLSLAIYANLVERSDGVTAEQLAGYKKPGLHTAIERVVSRIDDPRVQWLLRYGVLPRGLCYEFVVKVMWPYLSEGMSGESEIDHPDRDERPYDSRIFPTGLKPPVSEDELREIWTSLLEYAADYGWVTTSRAKDTVEFRSDLVKPLRDLVRAREVFVHIQRDAADYFALKGQQDDAGWLNWTKEAIFHRLQADPHAGAEAWRSAVVLARSKEHDDWCLELATDLLGSEWVDWTGEPIAPMTHQLLAEAHLERARAAAGLADRSRSGRDVMRSLEGGVGCEDPVWTDVEEGLAAAGALQARSDVELPADELLILNARLLTARGNTEQARELLLPLRETQRNSAEPASAAADVERALGQALPKSETRKAADHLSDSYRLAKQADDLPGARLSAQLRVRGLSDTGAYAEAMETLADARSEGILGHDDETALLETWLLIAAGQPERAIGVAASVTDSGIQAMETDLAVAVARYALDDPIGALESADRLLGRADGHDGIDPGMAVIGLAMRGMCLGRLHESGPASASLLEAASQAREVRDVDSVAFCAAVAAQLHIAVDGDLDEAAQALDEAERSNPNRTSVGWTWTRLARAQLMQKTKQADQAEALLDQTRDVLNESGADIALRMDIAVGGLAVADSTSAQRWLREVIDHLKTVTPPSARMFKLARMSDVAELTDMVDAELLDDLLATVDEPGHTAPFGPSPPSEQAAKQFIFAEILRVAGRVATARQVLDDALELRDGDLLGWWMFIDALQRLGPATPDEPAPPADIVEDRDGLPLVASCQIMLARRRMHIDALEVTTRRLEFADYALERWGIHNRWNAEAALGHAEIARKRGDHNGARLWAVEAVRIYSRLGASTNRAEIAARYELGDRVKGYDSDTVELRFGIPVDDRIAIRHRLAGQPDVVEKVSTEVIRSLTTGNTFARIRAIFTPLTEGWRAWSEQIAERILLPELNYRLAPSAGRHRDVRLVFSSHEVAALPWELCQSWRAGMPLVQAPGVNLLYRSVRTERREEGRTRAAQAALAHIGNFEGAPDGLAGARTTEALRAFQQRKGIEVDGVPGPDTFVNLRLALAEHMPPRPLRVVVIRPDPLSQLRRQRGDVAVGSGLLAKYAEHGAVVRVVDGPAVNSAANTIPMDAFIPDVIHVAAPIRLSSGAAVLDLCGDAAQRTPRSNSGDVLSVSSLHSFVQRVMRGARAPLIVVDAPMPATITEAVRTIGVRNFLAHQLLSLGAAQAVLAIGPAGTRDQIELLMTMIGGLSNGRTAAEIARDLQHTDNSPAADISRVLAFPGTAIFLERPPYALFPLWSS